MQPFPNTLTALVNATGFILKPWIQYLQQFTQAPPNFTKLNPTGTSFIYIAKEPGFISVNGGVISAISLQRGKLNTNVTGAIFIPVGINDQVGFAYSGIPTLYFIPIYGASTTS